MLTLEGLYRVCPHGRHRPSERGHAQLAHHQALRGNGGLSVSKALQRPVKDLRRATNGRHAPSLDNLPCVRVPHHDADRPRHALGAALKAAALEDNPFLPRYGALFAHGIDLGVVSKFVNATVGNFS